MLKYNKKTYNKDSDLIVKSYNVINTYPESTKKQYIIKTNKEVIYYDEYINSELYKEAIQFLIK